MSCVVITIDHVSMMSTEHVLVIAVEYMFTWYQGSYMYTW